MEPDVSGSRSGVIRPVDGRGTIVASPGDGGRATSAVVERDLGGADPRTGPDAPSAGE